MLNQWQIHQQDVNPTKTGTHFMNKEIYTLFMQCAIIKESLFLCVPRELYFIPGKRNDSVLKFLLGIKHICKYYFPTKSLLSKEEVQSLLSCSVCVCGGGIFLSMAGIGGSSDPGYVTF